MKLWNHYKKEMKLASRGFYFYVELVVAVIILAVLLMVVPTEKKDQIKEAIFCNMSDEEFEKLVQKKEGKGYVKRVEDEVFKLKPATLRYTDDQGKLVTKEYKDKKKVTARQYEHYDALTGKHTKTKFIFDNFDDMLRVAYAKKYIGTKMWYGEDHLDYYHNILFGYETKRYKNLLKVSHGTMDMSVIAKQAEIEKDHTVYIGREEVLNNRENLIPVILLMLNGMLGMMVIIAYISVDKSEGILKALCVTPLHMEDYLLSKTLVALTTVLLSSAIITVPVMGAGPNYILLLLSVFSMGFLSCAIGIFLSTFFEDVKSAFGAIMIVGIVLLLPVISYLVPMFHPKWIEFMPSWYMMDAIKESLLSHGDITYILKSSGFLLISGGMIYEIAKKRYTKILGI